MIENIRGKTTQDIFNGVNSNAARVVPKELHERALDLLDALNAMTNINDLRLPPSNRLHKLKGNLKGHWSVSINMQWRIIFKWINGKIYDVRITDYH